jgi:hypothetical protein
MVPQASLYWAIGRRSWARHQPERIHASPPKFEIRDSRRVNVIEEQIAEAEAVLAEAERLIGELDPTHHFDGAIASTFPQTARGIRARSRSSPSTRT